MESHLRRCSLGCATVGCLLFMGCSNPGPLAQRPFGSVDHVATHAQVRQERTTQTGRPVALGAEPTLADYQRHAAAHHPGLEAMFQDWAAAVERVPQVSTLPDPRVTYGYYLGEVETRVGPMQHSLSLSQTFPWWGTLSDRRDAALQDARAAAARFEAARLDLVFRVEEAHNELYFLKRSIDITADSVDLLSQFQEIAQSRYRVGTAGHPDLLKIQIELGILEDRLRRLNELRAPRSARLVAAVNGDPGSVPWPAGLSDRVTDAAVDEFLWLLWQDNPEIEALDAGIKREWIATRLARKAGRPDLTVGLAYTAIGERNDVTIPENGDDAVLATFSVNLPIWRNKYDAAVREATARRLAAMGRRGALGNQLQSDLSEVVFRHTDARRRVGLYQDTLIPKAGESLQASLSSYANGASDFLDLVDTQQTLLEFQLELERALVDRATSFAQLERLLGGDVPGSATTQPTEGER